MKTSDQQRVGAELDALHAAARQAYEAKDLSAYMEVFLPSATYRQSNGETIGRDKLAQEVANQWALVGAVTTSYVRESIEIGETEVLEIVIQRAVAEPLEFFLLKREWKLYRRGIYAWVQTEGDWRIKHVEVLDEKLTPPDPLYAWVDAVSSSPEKRFSPRRASRLFIVVLLISILTALPVGLIQFGFQWLKDAEKEREREKRLEEEWKKAEKAVREGKGRSGEAAKRLFGINGPARKPVKK